MNKCVWMKLLGLLRTSLVAQRIKCLPTMRETWVQSLGQEDPLGKETATTPVLLPGKSHGLSSSHGGVWQAIVHESRLSPKMTE